MNSFIDLLSSHRSVRRFKDRPVALATLKTIIRAAQCASTSHHFQAYVIIHVKDTENKKHIAQLAGPQPWVAQAPVFLVFCADLTRLEQTCLWHGLDAEKGWAEQFVVATVDTALAGQNCMIAAESTGLGGVFIGGIRNDPQTICDLLEIPDHAYPVFGMCLGYPDQSPDIKPRLPLDLIFKSDTFHSDADKQNQKKITDKYDRQIRRYYLNRDSNLKDQTWTSQTAQFMSRVIRPHMKEFLTKRGFFIK